MKLEDFIEIEPDITEGFVIDIEESELVERLMNDLEIISEATNIATTHGEDLVYVKSLKELRKKAEQIIKAGMKKNPVKTAPLIAKVRYLTGRGSGDERIKNAAKGIFKGGVPKEDSVFNVNKADIELIKANEEAGTSKKSELKRNQIRYKKSQKAGDYRILTLSNLFALKIGKKVYTVKSAESKIEVYAEAAAKAVVDSRTKLAKVCKEFGLKVPSIPSSEADAKKYIIDVLIKPQSKNAKDQKKRRDEIEKRKSDAKAAGDTIAKDDYVISTDSFRHGKVVIIAQLHLDKVVDAMGIDGITASKVPDFWTGTKKAWGDKVKDNKAEITDRISELAGGNASVSLGRAGGWITIRFTK